ncbi:hypothetical protein GCM10020254_44140 [Streptomyces goshikiensis]
MQGQRDALEDVVTDMRHQAAPEALAGVAVGDEDHPDGGEVRRGRVGSVPGDDAGGGEALSVRGVDAVAVAGGEE